VEAVYRLPCYKVVNGRWLQQVMRREYGRESVVIPNGVDWSQFDVGPRPKPSVPTVGFLYSRSRLKGAHTAMEALRIAQRRLPQLHVVSFGTDSIMRAHVPPANFEFHQRPPQLLIPKLYARASCWIVPSLSEGLPMPGLEAAACRCPVVATRCGGTEDYVEDGVNGYLVAVEDAHAIAERLLDVLCSDEAQWRRMSEASHQIARRFDWDRSAELLESFLYEAMRFGTGSVVAGSSDAAVERGPG
jgi:glycosyltransferase involved in cell wall biosynthesis